MDSERKETTNILACSLGGGVAGFFVDMVLFPLDTLKTRLQSAQGFMKSGGFRGVYKGIGPQALGSAPSAALFFFTYESFKRYVEPKVPSNAIPIVHMTAASFAEIVSCLVKVPTEVVKQRRQTFAESSSVRILVHAWKSEGFRKGLYRGFGSTIIREVPFSFMEFPIFEYLKLTYRTNFKNNIPLESWEVAACGSIAGTIAGGITTPLDVAKTRIMLANKKTAELNVRTVLKNVYQEQGITGLFAGFVPRVLWIALGGWLFFGMYDLSKKYFTRVLDSERDVRR